MIYRCYLVTNSKCDFVDQISSFCHYRYFHLTCVGPSREKITCSTAIGEEMKDGLEEENERYLKVVSHYYKYGMLLFIDREGLGR
jgi:hypothetical protein